jgi:hypothetical protein
MKRLITVAVLACSLVLATSAAAAGPLTGTYQAVISGKSKALNGTWVLSFAANGFYTVAKKPNTNAILVGGSSTLSGKSLTLADHQGKMACKTPAEYTFTKAGTHLKFKKVSDSCAGRLVILGAAWTKLG